MEKSYKKSICLGLVLLLTSPVLANQSINIEIGQSDTSFEYRSEIHKELEVAASVEKVWSLWTSKEGLQKFLAPKVNIEPTPLGSIQAIFFPDKPEGEQGSEKNLILGMQKHRMLSFTWDAPLHFPHIRSQRTVVMIYFYPTEEGNTRITLTQTGWGKGGEWDQAFHYFEKAWDIVLGRMGYAISEGRVDWSDPYIPTESYSVNRIN